MHPAEWAHGLDGMSVLWPLLMAKSEGWSPGAAPGREGLQPGQGGQHRQSVWGRLSVFSISEPRYGRLGLWPFSRRGDEHRPLPKPFTKSSPPPVTMVGHSQGKRLHARQAQSRQRSHCSSETALRRHALAFVPQLGNEETLTLVRREKKSHRMPSRLPPRTPPPTQ